MVPANDTSAHEILRSQPRWLLLAEAMLGILLIGFLDYATGWELSLFVFYGLPIAMAVWYGNRRIGVTLALWSALVWWAANAADNPYHTTWGYLLASVSRLAYFTFVAIGTA